MEAGGTVTQCVRQERTQHRGAGRQISSAWCLGEVEEKDKFRFLFALEILPGNPAFVKFGGHAVMPVQQEMRKGPPWMAGGRSRLV